MVDSPIGSHILIPELRIYALAAVAICLVSCVALSAHVHARWLSARGVDFMSAHCVILAVVVAGASTVLTVRGVFGEVGVRTLWLAPFAAMGGWLSVWADRSIVRRYLRQRDRKRNAGPGARELGRLTPQVRSVKGVFGRKQSSARTVGAERMQERWDAMPSGMRLRLPTILGIAALEELVFRGALFRLIGGVGGIATMAFLIVVVGSVFCLSHVFFGWVHVFAKAPLCAIATLLSLVAGGPLLAVVAHVYFNWTIWRQTTNASRSTATREVGLQLIR